MTSGPVVDWAILKIAQRCNINCDYCYVYNRGDDGWRSRPAVMSDAVVAAFVSRAVTQVSEFALKEFHVELHGGEPLLVGRKRFARICEQIKHGIPVPVRFHLQTNGLLLDEAWLKLLDSYDIGIGISLDGPPDLHDRHRVDHFGKGTGKQLMLRLNRLSKDVLFHRLFGGILCVMSDPMPDGGELLDWFVANGVRDVDFLLPDGNYANPPTPDFSAEPYARFWQQVYDRWSSYGRDAPRVRTLHSLLRGLTGEAATLDAHGADLRSMIVIETDGSVGISDVGRICPPLNADVHNILTDDFRLHQERADLEAIQKPSKTCTDCEWFGACGGGYLPHRFDGEGFDNPSLYCEVWKSLLSRMDDDIRTELETIRSDETLQPSHAAG